MTAFICDHATASASVADGTQNINNQPEWLRIPDARKYFGVTRSWLYERLKTGEIVSRSLRKRGAMRGIRLVSRDSLAAFIEGEGGVQ